MTPTLAPIRSLLLIASLALAACSQQAPAPTGQAAQPATSTQAATAGSDATAATASAETPAKASAAQAAEASAQSARTPGPITPPSGPAPVLGTDYVEIAGGAPYQPGTGKIEVVEVFGYTCPHCAAFEPLVSDWAAELPADVNFVQVAAPFGGYWMPYAKAYYTARAMGLVEQTHDAMFRAIHVERSLPVQPLPTDAQLAQFYAQYGADPEQFTSTMNSFAINAEVNRALQFLQRSGVTATPSMIVNGKYRITGGRSLQDVLRITEHVIARARAEAGSSGTSDGADDADAS